MLCRNIFCQNIVCEDIFLKYNYCKIYFVIVYFIQCICPTLFCLSIIFCPVYAGPVGYWLYGLWASWREKLLRPKFMKVWDDVLVDVVILRKISFQDRLLSCILNVESRLTKNRSLQLYNNSQQEYSSAVFVSGTFSDINGSRSEDRPLRWQWPSETV